jgi:AraC family transcriptional regulator
MQVTWRLPAAIAESAALAVPSTTIVPPWALHRPGFGATFTSVVLHLSPRVIELTADELLGTAHVELRGGPTADAALAYLGATAAAELRCGWRDSVFLDALTHVVAGHLVRRHAHGRRAAHAAVHNDRLTTTQLGRLRDLVISRLDEPPLLAEMAAAFGLRPHRFVRMLRHSTRLGPHGYVTQLRVEHARQLLRQSEMTLSEIALALGFSNQSHFTAVFHERAGVTPGAYRRNS